MLAEYDIRTLTAESPLLNLKTRLAGELILPSDEAYDDARSVFIGNADKRPGVLVRAGDAIDVIRAVNFAREQQLDVAVRSGGHSLAGYGTIDGGMVVDLSAMKSISIDPERRVARVQPGRTWKEYALKAQEYGLATSSGDVGSVGVGGLALGGGIGWFVRKHGLTVDHLRSVDVVTADGRLLTASETENPDLFWALCGGGGNFGIATSFELALHPTPQTLGGAVFYSGERAQEVLADYNRIAHDAPDGLSTQAIVMHAPPLPFIVPEHHGKLVVAILLAYTGDLSEGERVVAPLRSLGTPIADLVGPMPYSGMFKLTEDVAVKGMHHSMRSMYLNQVESGLLDQVVSFMERATSPAAIVQFRVLGGAMARVPEEATAFAHRDKPYMVSLINAWPGGGEASHHYAWTQAFWDATRHYGSGVYVNFLEQEGASRVREAYKPATYDRLAQVKQTYDPTNFFRQNQNITPTA